MSNKKREDCFDIAKGIAILCIILGHMGIARVNSFVFTFARLFAVVFKAFCEFLSPEFPT